MTNERAYSASCAGDELCSWWFMAEAALYLALPPFSTNIGAQLAVSGALRSPAPPTLRTGRARGISPQLPRPRARRFSHLGSRELRLEGELPWQYTPPANWDVTGNGFIT